MSSMFPGGAKADGRPQFENYWYRAKQQKRKDWIQKNLLEF